MRRYSILHVPLLAFYSKPLYQDVRRFWRGANVLYLLLLLAVCWLPSMIVLHAGLSRFAARVAPPIIAQMPPITIRNGEASVQGQQPCIIKDPESDKPIAIIDTTGEITSLEGTGAAVLLTRTKVVTAEREHQTRTFELSGVNDFYVDSHVLTKWLTLAKRWLVIVLYPCALLMSYAYRLLQAVIYAAVGMLFARSLHANMTYQASMRLAIVATTPAIILDTIVELAGLRIPFWWPICLLIAMSYLYFGVKVNAEPAPSDITPSPDVPTFGAP